MSRLRSKDNDGTSYFFEEDGKLTVKKTEDVNPLLKRNKELYNHNDGYTASREMKRVASIPRIMLEIWAKEYNGTNNWFGLPSEVRKKILREKLNSSDYRYFRTASGRL
jgi:hypothetical protein